MKPEINFVEESDNNEELFKNCKKDQDLAIELFTNMKKHSVLGKPETYNRLFNCDLNFIKRLARKWKQQTLSKKELFQRTRIVRITFQSRPRNSRRRIRPCSSKDCILFNRRLQQVRN